MERQWREERKEADRDGGADGCDTVVDRVLADEADSVRVNFGCGCGLGFWAKTSSEIAVSTIKQCWRRHENTESSETDRGGYRNI
jgi:hypothetical protein